MKWCCGVVVLWLSGILRKDCCDLDVCGQNDGAL